MATISFKAYVFENEVISFNRTGKWDRELLETRRFGIDADVATNYVYLYEKLENTFPILRRKYYTVEWRDKKNEIIKISTNEELKIAVEEMSKNNICKLYITPRVNYNPDRLAMLHDQIDVEETLYHDVTCNVCWKAVRGLRFMCIQCLDYDLCNDCMLLGYHHEHYLIRIVHPFDRWKDNDYLLVRYLWKWAKHCKDDEGKYRSNKRGGCPLFNSTSSKVGLFDSSVVNSLADFITDMYAAPSDDHEQKRFKEQDRDPSAEAAIEATEDPQEATKNSFSQLLKIVKDNISNISQFLDPLGINVSVIINKDSPRNKLAGAKTSPQEPENRAFTSEDSAKKFPGEGKKLRDEIVNTSEKTAAPLTNGVSSPKEPTATSAEQASEEWTIVHPQSESNNTSRTSSTSSLNEAIPKQVTPATTTAELKKTESPKQNIYPPLAREVKE